ncbi:MAG: calcium/sodium antiporter [Pseudomonadota bacterium]|nr:calcium/sodium antiporter [Pseudomonadota bacterium]
MLISIFFLIFGIFLLVKGAEILISTSLSIGKKLKISEFFIGLIIIGFGTSISELLVSIDAVLKDTPDLSVGNIIGSNIANLLLVTFTAGFLSELKKPKTANFDLIFHLVCHLFFLFVFFFSIFNKNFGLIFLSLFSFYLYKCLKKSSSEDVDEIKIEDDFFSRISFISPFKYGTPLLILSIFVTLLGADLTVDSAKTISNLLKISDSFIGLTVIALGTSLPEIATSITAARKGKINIIVGNIIGSNIYNLLLILGLTSLFPAFSYNKEILSSDVIFLIVSVCFFSFLVFNRITIGRKVSYICLLAYIYYLINLYLKNF